MATVKEVSRQKCDVRYVRFFLKELDLFLQGGIEADTFVSLMGRLQKSEVQPIKDAMHNLKCEFGLTRTDEWTDEDFVGFPGSFAQRAFCIFLKEGLEIELDVKSEKGEPHPILDIVIKDSHLNTRVANLLGQAGLDVITVRQLVLKTEKELLVHQGFGHTALSDVQEWLAQISDGQLCLGMNDEYIEKYVKNST